MKNKNLKIYYLEKMSSIKRRVISNVVNFVLRAVVGETHNEKAVDSFMEGVTRF